MTPRLVLPNPELRESFLEALDESVRAGDTEASEAARIRSDFEGYLRWLEQGRRGENLKPGHVPWTEFWIEDRGHYVGRVSLRHRLSPRLERLGGHVGYDVRPTARRRGYGRFGLGAVLLEARSRGLERILISCDDDNLGSIRIIESCGGRLQDVVRNEGRPVPTRRYWIDLSPG